MSNMKLGSQNVRNHCAGSSFLWLSVMKSGIAGGRSFTAFGNWDGFYEKKLFLISHPTIGASHPTLKIIQKPSSPGSLPVKLQHCPSLA